MRLQSYRSAANARRCHILASLPVACPRSSTLCLLALLVMLCRRQVLTLHLGASATVGPQQHCAFLSLLWLPDFLALPFSSALKMQKELRAALQNFTITCHYDAAQNT